MVSLLRCALCAASCISGDEAVFRISGERPEYYGTPWQHNIDEDDMRSDSRGGDAATTPAPSATDSRQSRH